MTTPLLSAGIAKLSFELTPASGDQFVNAERSVRDGNIINLLDGDGMIYTSQGMNLSRQVLAERLNTYVASEYGTSFSALPTLQGGTLTLPAGRFILQGEFFQLWGPLTDGAQQFDVTSLPAGRYALVLETWRAAAGVTTYGRAARPAFFAGVVSRDNKKDDTTFFKGGNLAAVRGVSDEGFITGTLESQRALQRQYTLRLIPDTDLRGTPALSAAEPDIAGTLYSGEGAVLTAVSPFSWTSYQRAVDRTFHACKLAIVTIGHGGATLEVNVPHLGKSARSEGQPLVPCIPALPEYQQFLAAELSKAATERAALRERIERLERLTEAGHYLASAQLIQTQSEQRIFFTAEGSDPLGWHDNSTISNRFVMDFKGAVSFDAHLTYTASGATGFDGVRGAALYRNGEDTGLRATQVALGEHDLTVQFSGEVEVAVSDYLEIVALHSSTKTQLTLEGARLSLRRVR